MSLPLVMTAAGATAADAATVNAEIIALATASDPGLTANLPGTLIEDIDRKSTRLNSSHIPLSRMPSSA